MLAALGERLTNAEIAARLFVSERTVESHVSALLRKLEASSRLELAQLAHAHHRAATGSLPGPLELLLEAGGYVGREAERERLRELWRAVLAGQMLVVVVSGEAGIGKSRLVAEFTAEVSASARVLLGSCFEDSDARYQPFVQAIETDIAGVSDSTLRRWVDAEASSLGRIVPEIDRRCDRSAAVGGTDRLDGQSGVPAAIGRYLSRSASDGPVVCVLEDVHWATATTLATVRFLARGGTRAPVLIVLTTRDTPPDLDEGLKLFLSELSRIPTVESIRSRVCPRPTSPRSSTTSARRWMLPQLPPTPRATPCSSVRWRTRRRAPPPRCTPCWPGATPCSATVTLPSSTLPL